MAIGTNSVLGSGSTVAPGSTGPSVATVQRLLGVTVDGVDGPQTTAAVKDFQRARGLAADGIVGRQTWAALNEPTVAEGARGAAVERVQKDLHVTADGFDGPRTTSAIEQFQKAHGLAMDGIVGKQTWAALDDAEHASSAIAAAAKQKHAPVATAKPPVPAAPTAPAASAGGSSSFETNMRKLVIDSEGYRNRVYTDTKGNPTVGIGFNLNRGDAPSALAAVGADYDGVRAGTKRLTDAQVDSLFSSDLQNAEGAARSAVSNFDRLGDARKSVIVDMEFNLGARGFSQFTGTIGAIEKGDFNSAADHMQDSAWYGQVGRRSVRDVEMMRSGNYPASY